MIYTSSDTNAQTGTVTVETWDTAAGYTRTVNGATVEQRALTADESAAFAAREQAEMEAANKIDIEGAIDAAITKLDTLIAAPALGTVPAGTLTTAQLSTALRTLRDQAQATRAGAQDVALILKQTIKLVRGDYDTIT